MMKTLCMLLALIASASAFVAQPQQAASRNFKLQASRPNQFVEAFTAASIAIATHPLVALAEDADGDYEYGAVDAPIGIAVAGGCVAILTALLPVVMQGGEDAFNEMKEEDADTWGSGNAGRLNKRR